MNPLPRFTDSEIEEELSLLREQSAKPWARFETKSACFIIRTLRILCGVVLFGFFVYCATNAMEKFDTPFAAQSITGIASGIFWASMSVLLVTWSWSAAFGPGPTPSETSEKMRNRALESLTTKRPAGISIQTPANR